MPAIKPGSPGCLPCILPHYPPPASARLCPQAELHTILALGVPQSRIIFAHPCKRPSDIKYAAEHNIEYTTFDTESELHKIAAANPK